MAYSKEVKEKILVKIKNGEKIKDISEETGISRPTLYKWAKEIEKQATIIKKEENIKKVKRNDDRQSMDEIITSKEIKRLIKLKKIDEAKKLTNKYLSSPVIQSQRIKILIKKRQFQEAKEIGERFKDNLPIRSQMVTIAMEEGKIEETTKEYWKEEKDIQLIKNIIKTQIYWDKITNESIDQINNNKDLTEYEKTIILLAICEKKELPKRIKQIVALNKGKFTQKQQKELCKILDRSKSKRKTIFDLGFYDEILGWNFDSKLNQQYIEEKEKEEIEKRKLEEKKKEEIAKRKLEEKKKEEIAKRKLEEKKKEEVAERKSEETEKDQKEKINKKKIENNKQTRKTDRQNEKINYIIEYFRKIKPEIYSEMQSINPSKQKKAIQKWDRIEDIIEQLKNNVNSIKIENLYAKIEAITKNDLER